MLALQPQSIQTVLCLGCQADDIEIGCGGTILRLLEQHPGISVWWVVLSGEGGREQESLASAEAWLAEAGARNIILQTFRDRYFPCQGAPIKDFIHSIADQVNPDVVFTHRRDDAHQDHRLLGELTWNAFRDHLLLEYEIPKYDGDLRSPNAFVPLPESTCARKVELLRKFFVSQHDKAWFTPDTFWALLRLRGLECNSPTRFAEGFHARKTVLF